MNLEIIEKYIDDDLDQKELLEFEEILSSNSHLKQDYNLSLAINNSIIEDDVIQLRETLDYMYDNNTVVRRLPNTFIKRKIYYVAASIAIILTLGGIVNKLINPDLTHNEIYDKYYQAYEITGTFRSGNTEVDKVFLSAIQKYEEQDFEKAMVLFEEVLDIRKNDMALNLYSGITYMEDEKYQNASISFNHIIDDNNNLFVEHAKWYLALCYVVTEETKKAKVLFNELIKDDSFYSRDAQKILKDIGD